MRRLVVLVIAVLGACGTPAPPATCEYVCSDADLECLQTDPSCFVCYYDTCCHWNGSQWDELYTDCARDRPPDARPDAAPDAMPDAMPDAPPDATASAAAADTPRSPPAR